RPNFFGKKPSRRVLHLETIFLSFFLRISRQIPVHVRLSHSSRRSKTTAGRDAYDASKLGKLEGLEAVRKKPGMYIGGTDERALHHCVSEVLDNSVDEHLAGHCNKIEVGIHVDGSISIRDNGRGIPVDI